jgi:hypothetical protein
MYESHEGENFYFSLNCSIRLANNRRHLSELLHTVRNRVCEIGGFVVTCEKREPVDILLGHKSRHFL